MSVERIAAIATIAGTGVLLIFAATDNWDRIYPLPLLILLVGALVGVSLLYVRERRRKRTNTYGEVRDENREQREQEQKETRRNITLILNEVRSNRRLLEGASTGSARLRFTSSENWVAHRISVAELKNAGWAYAKTQEAYDAFANIDQMNTHPSVRTPSILDLTAAAGKAKGAEKALAGLLKGVEGQQGRYSLTGVQQDE